MSLKESNDVGGYRAQTLTRGLAVLRTIADARGPLTLQQLHDRTEIPKPTLVRLLAILTHEQCTVRLDDRPTYGLGPIVTAIAAGVTGDLDPEAMCRPYLERLSGSVGHTANLGVLRHDGQVLHLSVVLSDRPIRYNARSGTIDEAYCTGLGKALLSRLDKDALDITLQNVKFVARTPRTLTSRSKLNADLRKARQQGFAYDAEEGAAGLCCFAVPVSVNGRTIAAISVSGPAGELPPEQCTVVVPALHAVAEDIGADEALVRVLSVMNPA